MAYILWNSNFRKFERTDFRLFDIHSSSFQEVHAHPADALATTAAAATVSDDEEALMATTATWYTLNR